MTNKTLVLLVSTILFSCDGKQSKPQSNHVDSTKANKEVLLIGTFHYNNPGADVAKTKSFDIMSEESQNELEQISKSIQEYNPTKIFVEWPYNEQNELDSLYTLYQENQYFTNDSLSDFYLQNEIFQLAFRAAHANDIEKVYGIDYSTSFPFNEVMKDIEEANQTELMSKIQNGITKITVDFDNKIEAGVSLVELTYYLNTPEMRKFSNYFHNNLMLLAGDTDDFNGPLLTSEWYKRNLYMWSLAQKNTMDTDERIMILVGASHAAMFELFINENDDWKIKELHEIVKK
ncbi:DUF5694 domain-containing protein [Spongiivirga sp. MCCC 1A20706]|uniref:DUF5694 domain-containing protein n=1 Tax=Spongiivirga sp. MCCC 1A20706 TaxID=3160963 RepID=UPI003977BFFA